MQIQVKILVVENSEHNDFRVCICHAQLFPYVSPDVQSSRSHSILQDIVSTLRSSNIFPRLASDPTLGFWDTYQVEADEHDRELFEKYNGSMDTGLIFVSFHLVILHRS